MRRRNRQNVCYVGVFFVWMYTIHICWELTGKYPIYLETSKQRLGFGIERHSSVNEMTPSTDGNDFNTSYHSHVAPTASPTVKEDYSSTRTSAATVQNKNKMVTRAADYKFNFKFIQNPAVKCENISYNETLLFVSWKAKVDFNLLFVIKSAPSNKERRDVIRRTWGSEDYMFQNGVILRTVFVVGVTNVSSYNEQIAEEIRNHGDIIHVDFFDSYYNNTIKTISSVNWASRYCSKADFVVLLDDDYMVNPHNLVKMIQEIPPHKRDKLYMGRLFKGFSPHRDPKSKWYITQEEYPYKKYPSFISAGTVLLSIDVINKFRITMQYVKPFKLDDIYLSMLAERLGIQPRSHPFFRCRKVMPEHEHFQSLVTCHKYRVQDIEQSWKAIRQI